MVRVVSMTSYPPRQRHVERDIQLAGMESTLVILQRATHAYA